MYTPEVYIGGNHMNTEKFQKKYKEYLVQNADPERSRKEQSYFYVDRKHYGVSIKKIREYIKRYKKDLNTMEKAKVLKLAEELWKQPSFQEKTLTLFILELHKSKLDISNMPMIEKMMRESKTWALLDNLIIPLMPTILEKDESVYSYLKDWVKDHDFWVRRSALLAQLLFFRHDCGGDRQLFFDMAKTQFDESWIDETYKDKEEAKRARFFIRKAIGWTLREMSQKKPDIVFKFIKRNKELMSGLTFREASRKLPPALVKKMEN